MSRLRTPVGSHDHILGPVDAPVILVEYGDFQCPFCGQAYEEVNKVLASMGDQLRYVFRHFPLTQAHPYALQAAEAAEAADGQGKFWEMHGMLYENQQALDPESLLAYAQKLGLDMERFTREVSEHRYLERIRRDFMGGVRSGVSGTPGFFINGARYQGDFSASSLITVLQGGGIESPSYF
ncbi:disulfide bond formation protein DsbA [Myxococcus llanfairpwllgwyngyllgogerychwyrndrobwllllantysiliogogogochensis]|uniref:Disulfide bond formation protein DsbA n=1 Tax=Myxococcus llanfairpwllgwyngyllgogerychwyrndrobwllllantysiliogogogochensis TaxID=2590453 RepID=A0A540X8B8_9BACT|nr:thioredoxin domain-containing protein [Myxococcus llanfairpwllgwyngyllgogerychwyrndrobwllllantysiliogogogochensis]TQF17545.1 disulfide bond formation protein DsbA [Myxococcus llanfairpwllgwyngyllgogerychwyrndrobwllllantysiliogogogochensis]